jgi:hypothetical protein
MALWIVRSNRFPDTRASSRPRIRVHAHAYTYAREAIGKGGRKGKGFGTYPPTRRLNFKRSQAELRDHIISELDSFLPRLGVKQAATSPPRAREERPAGAAPGRTHGGFS